VHDAGALHALHVEPHVERDAQPRAQPQARELGARGPHLARMLPQRQPAQEERAEDDAPGDQAARREAPRLDQRPLGEQGRQPEEELHPEQGQEALDAAAPGSWEAREDSAGARARARPRHSRLRGRLRASERAPPARTSGGSAGGLRLDSADGFRPPPPDAARVAGSRPGNASAASRPGPDDRPRALRLGPEPAHAAHACGAWCSRATTGSTWSR
jgi:hypothetical protein